MKKMPDWLSGYGLWLLQALLLPLMAGAQVDNASKLKTLEVEDAQGYKTDLAALHSKVVFINFWSLTCAPCKAEMPTISRLKEHYANDTDFVVFPVDLDHNFAADMQYFADKQIGLDVYAPAGVIPQSVFKGALPTTVVIANDGHIAYYFEGADHYDSPAFYRLTDSLLGR